VEQTKNLQLPGNPRYQPKDLIKVWGYDYLYQSYIAVELAVMETLAEAGVIPADEFRLMTPAVTASLAEITTSEVDEIERKVTKHDIRALVHAMQQRMPEPLRRWVHMPLTSYDVIDTARAMQFVSAHNVVISKLMQLLYIFAARCRDHADTLMIGRTHGQHALPITAGFWLATILSRLIANTISLDAAAGNLVGKISGAVGAYNAQVGLGMYCVGDGPTFEERVLGKLGLAPALVSTQIAPPEPLADYLFATMKLVAALGQFGEDCRQLMRTEIGEICEPFAATQVGSSTMAHKRNPINFEGLVAAWISSQAEYGKVVGTLISEHQRDLTGSAVSRDYPVIVINLVRQMDTLLRADKAGKSFLERINIDKEACLKNFKMSAHLVMAEPLYIALQQYGYPGDAHELVNHKVVPEATRTGMSLIDTMRCLARESYDASIPGGRADWQLFADALMRLPDSVQEKLGRPEEYIGRAPEIARETAARAIALIASL
jgi:adenylosuccinate lyase